MNGRQARAMGFAAVVVTPWPTHARISHGRLTIRVGKITLSGTFLAHGRVAGKIKVTQECVQPPNFNSGPIRHKTFSWSATSEPSGSASRYCADHFRRFANGKTFNFTGIVAIRTTCVAVNSAINAGTFTPTTDPATGQERFFGAFATPGWTCTNKNNSFRVYNCSQGSASFSFGRSGA